MVSKQFTFLGLLETEIEKIQTKIDQIRDKIQESDSQKPHIGTAFIVFELPQHAEIFRKFLSLNK